MKPITERRSGNDRRVSTEKVTFPMRDRDGNFSYAKIVVRQQIVEQKAWKSHLLICQVTPSTSTSKNFNWMKKSNLAFA